MIETPFIGAIEAYGPLTDEEVVNILSEYFRAVVGAEQMYEIDQDYDSDFIGDVAALPMAYAYQQLGLPDHNPQYGENCYYKPDLIIDGGNEVVFVDDDFEFDEGYLYYAFSYCH